MRTVRTGSGKSLPDREAKRDEQKARVEEALGKLVSLFRSGNLPDSLVRVAIRKGRGNRPSDSWSLSNFLLMLASGTEDARGYGQWQDVGRQVLKGSRGFDILRPVTVPVQDQETGEEGFRVVGFSPVRVFPIEVTEVVSPEKWDLSQEGTSCAPPTLPPLFEVSQALGVRVEWAAKTSEVWGWYSPRTSRIRLFTHDPGTFFHELAHHVDGLVSGPLNGGQDPIQEVVAETTSACLGILFRDEVPETEGRIGYSSRYVQAYMPEVEPYRAVQMVAARVSRVLLKILEVSESLASVPA